ncbi:MAG: hypothetical protein ACO3PD_05505 [Acidimicrobiales bacterium]
MTTSTTVIDGGSTDDTVPADAAEGAPDTPLAASTPLPPISLTDIPDLVAAWGTGTGDPLELARRLIGFPLEIVVPAASSPYSVRVELDGRDPAASWRWDWRYGAAAPAGVGQIDADLPEGGRGTIEGRLHFDPLFARFGWSNAAQVISDPSRGSGGPQSVNWAYRKDDPTFVIDELVAEAVGARAWVDEDIDVRNGDDRAGYAVEIALRSEAGSIVVPLLAALLAEAPQLPGSRVIELDLVSYDRTDESLFAEEGLRYLELGVVWELQPDAEEAARQSYSLGLDGTVFQMGEESFSDAGFIRVVDATVDSNGVWRQPVILLRRYPGFISVWRADDGTLRSGMDVTLEPNREILQPVAG